MPSGGPSQDWWMPPSTSNTRWSAPSQHCDDELIHAFSVPKVLSSLTHNVFVFWERQEAASARAGESVRRCILAAIGVIIIS